MCANFSALIRSMRNRFPDMMFSCTMGFGADAWNRLFPEQGKPKELKTFEEIKGEKHTAVSTPGDLLFHICAKQMGYYHQMNVDKDSYFSFFSISFVNEIVLF